MKIFINTALPGKIIIALIKGNLIFKKESKTNHNQDEKLLPLIKKFLEKHNFFWQDLQGIIVISGPASFTALRIGVVTANTLGFALKISVVGVKLSTNGSNNLDQLIQEGIKKLKKTSKDQVVRPFYGKDPNIIGSTRLSLNKQ